MLTPLYQLNKLTTFKFMKTIRIQKAEADKVDKTNKFS